MKIPWNNPHHALWPWLAFAVGFWLLTWQTNFVAYLAGALAIAFSAYVSYRRNKNQVNERNAADPLHPYSP